MPRAREIRLELDDGRRIVEQLDDVVAASEAEVRARFCAAAGAPAQAILRFVDGIAGARDAGVLVTLCAPAARRAQAALA